MKTSKCWTYVAMAKLPTEQMNRAGVLAIYVQSSNQDAAKGVKEKIIPMVTECHRKSMKIEETTAVTFLAG
jgi:hypothetical protein